MAETSHVPLSVQNLSKRYPGTTGYALDHVSLEVRKGEVYGFLGANGAGKSTTIRTLLNFLQPSEGTARIFGLDIVRDSVAIKRRVGYLAGDVVLYAKVTGSQLLSYLASLHGGVDTSYVQELTERFEAQVDKPIGTLSKGNRQKIGLLQALMHKPDLLILDEPTSGLDPLMQERFYEVINQRTQEGSAVFLSSHSLSEVQHLCDRVGIIREGKLMREASIAELTSDVHPVFNIVFARPPAEAKLRQLHSLQLLSLHGASAKLRTRNDITAALKELTIFPIASLSVENDQLEDRFMSYYHQEEDS